MDNEEYLKALVKISDIKKQIEKFCDNNRKNLIENCNKETCRFILPDDYYYEGSYFDSAMAEYAARCCICGYTIPGSDASLKYQKNLTEEIKSHFKGENKTSYIYGKYFIEKEKNASNS